MAKTKPQDASAARESTAKLKAAMLQALEKTLGIITPAAKMVGISRETHRKWCISDPDYASKVSELESVALDFAESMLTKRMEQGSDAAVIFFLKTRGKARGYVERTEHIVETTENLAARISYEQAQNLLANAGLEPPKKSDALTADE